MKFCELLQDYLDREAEIDEVVGELKENTAKITRDLNKLHDYVKALEEECHYHIRFLAAVANFSKRSRNN